MDSDLEKQLGEHFRVLGFDLNEVKKDGAYIVPSEFEGPLNQKISDIDGDTSAEDAKKVVAAVQFVFSVITYQDDYTDCIIYLTGLVDGTSTDEQKDDNDKYKALLASMFAARESWVKFKIERMKIDEEIKKRAEECEARKKETVVISAACERATAEITTSKMRCDKDKKALTTIQAKYNAVKVLLVDVEIDGEGENAAPEMGYPRLHGSSSAPATKKAKKANTGEKGEKGEKARQLPSDETLFLANGVPCKVLQSGKDFIRLSWNPRNMIRSVTVSIKQNKPNEMRDDKTLVTLDLPSSRNTYRTTTYYSSDGTCINERGDFVWVVRSDVRNNKMERQIIELKTLNIPLLDDEDREKITGRSGV